MHHQIKFESNHGAEFYHDLQRQVSRYFKEHNKSKSGGWAIIGKSLVLLGTFLTPYLLILFLEPPLFLAALLLVLMGIGKAGVGMSVMHDALHGSFSRHQWVNRLFGGSLYLLGGNPVNWHIQHNLLHHTYPNVYKVDEDISTKGFVVRLSPESEHHEIHRFQWLYILPLYGMMTLSFMVKDFRQLYRYNKSGETRRLGMNPTGEMIKLVISKSIYLFAALGIPLIITSYTFWQVLIGFLIVHFTAGLILSIVFQLAHVVDRASYPQKNEQGNLTTTWAALQLAATANFAPKSAFLGWFTGGLNFQVEHHLFPNICHIHYKNIAPLVKATAAKYGLQYNSAPTMINALGSHFRMLRKLGDKEHLHLA